jgi:hypothetical protein
MTDPTPEEKEVASKIEYENRNHLCPHRRYGRCERCHEYLIREIVEIIRTLGKVPGVPPKGEENEEKK